jgi:pimeloyl-ACP methyl ester carboxylesterase
VFVLIHGGAHSSRCWDRLVPFLQGPALAIDLPGRGAHPARLDTVGLGDWIDSAVGDIEEGNVSDAVLVGHSMAGLSMPGILERVSARVRHVVYVSCTVPAEGESLISLVPADVAEVVRAQVPDPAGVVLSEDEVRASQCYDMDQEQTRFTLDRVVPEAFWPIRQPVSLVGLRHRVPSTWVKLTGDIAFPGPVQDEMAARAGCQDVVEIDCGHMAMITRPSELAGILNRLQAGTGGDGAL